MEEFFKCITREYPSIMGDYILPMIIAIFALALPLLTQTIARIDDKYQSTLLIEVFKNDRRYKRFLWILISALISSLLWILQIPRIGDWGSLNVLIDNSASILASVSCVCLVSSMFCLIELIYIYYIPKKLFDRLSKQYKQSKNNAELYFSAISKLMYYAIKNNDKVLSLEILYFYQGEFYKYKKDKESKTVEYPQVYYNFIYEANESLFMSPKQTTYFEESDLIGLLLSEVKNVTISNRTYLAIWTGLKQALFYDRDGFILAYWRKAHQYIEFSLPRIDKIYDYENFPKVNNQNEYDQREMERERFLEFHYAMGALLMFRKKYKLIAQITAWTNSIPPKYVLVPETMIEVINRYMAVDTEALYINPIYYEMRYPFPDVTGVNADGIIMGWMKRYLAVLFLRQYTLHECYTYSNTLEMPLPPKTPKEQKHWNEQLDSLIHFVKEHLANVELMQDLGLQNILSKEWLEKNNKPEPLALIESLKKDIEDKTEETSRTQKIDETKRQRLFNSTKQILTNTFNSYMPMFTQNEIMEKCKSLFVAGTYMPMEKAAFCSNQGISHVNYDTVTAEHVSRSIRQTAQNIFLLSERHKYKLNEDDLFASIKQLNLDAETFVIIVFGLNLSYFKDREGLKEQGKKWSYNGIPIIYIDDRSNELFSHSIIIIKKEDLPCVVHHEFDKDRTKEYQLTEIDNTHHIYASVIDLNEYDEIRKKVEQETNLTDLEKKVLVCIGLNTEFRIKNSTKCIHLGIYGMFNERVPKHEIEDVKNIWEHTQTN